MWNRLLLVIYDDAQTQKNTEILPGILNMLDDINNNAGWKLDSEILPATLSELQACPSIDLFASRLNED